VSAEVTDRYTSTRRFQMWLYAVSHGQLMLRSVKAEGEPRRVDILFKNVRSLNLPTTAEGLTISRIDDGFVMGGVNWTGHIEADACFVAEDEGEYFEPSPFADSLP
jgi:hypothetical protein